ncbi:MAG: thioredoxin family protein [Acidobacteria bacterium]|nr:thioredoxin family protein [Acidobacteriota bacterium]
MRGRPFSAGSRVVAALAALCAVGLLASGSPACAQAPTNAAASGAPLEENMPRSWFRNYDYGLEIDGKVLPEAGLYQMIGKPYMLVFGPVLDSAFVWSADPRVVRSVGKDKVTPKGEDELMLAESSFAAAAPIPWMQDGPEAVVFYAGQKRFKILRVPPIIGPTSADEMLKLLPAYRKGRDEYLPEPGAVAALKNVRKKVEIEVWFGSWCPHCRAVVPRFLKTIQEAANTHLAVSFYGVPREFGSYAPSTARDVKGLPTFILTQDGKELGRVRGEPASGSLEAELARIVKQGVVAAGN